MSDRWRNGVMLVALSGWLAVVVAHLVQGKLPDAALVSVPAGLILAFGAWPKQPRPPDPPVQRAAEPGGTS